MRTRLLAAIVTALLAVPVVSSTVSWEHKCPKASGTQHKCERDDR